jgi:hypothetical protein
VVIFLSGLHQKRQSFFMDAPSGHRGTLRNSLLASFESDLSRIFIFSEFPLGGSMVDSKRECEFLILLYVEECEAVEPRKI